LERVHEEIYSIFGFEFVPITAGSVLESNGANSLSQLPAGGSQVSGVAVVRPNGATISRSHYLRVAVLRNNHFATDRHVTFDHVMPVFGDHSVDSHPTQEHLITLAQQAGFEFLLVHDTTFLSAEHRPAPPAAASLAVLARIA
jgi:hypothetical protein